MLKEEQTTRAVPWRRLFVVIVAIVAVTLLVRRERVETPAAGVFAAFLLLISVAILIRAAVKTGSFLNGYTLVLGTFLLTYPLSAFVHLTGKDYVSLGFYEIAALDPHTQLHHVYLSLALVLFAQLALWIGLAPARPAAIANRSSNWCVSVPRFSFSPESFSQRVGIAGTTLLFSGSRQCASGCRNH